MTFREIEYMLALDRHRSITAAAAELHLSQPTMSIFLTSLEKELGVPLFERLNKKLIPTPAGKIYLEKARQIEALKCDLDLKLTDLTKELRGEFHFGCLERRACSFLPPLIRKFKEQYPGIDFYLHSHSSEEMLQQLYAGKLDTIYTNLPIYMLTKQNDAFTEIITRKDHVLVVLPHNHPAKAKAFYKTPSDPYPYLDLSELQNETFYLSRPIRALRHIVDHYIQTANIHPNVQEISRIDIGCQMAAEQLGISFTLESYAKDFSYSKPVDYYLTGDTNIEIAWRIIYRKSTIQTEYMKDFFRMIQQAESS